MFVIFMFSILLCPWNIQAPAAGKDSGPTLEQGKNDSPNFFEKGSKDEAVIKKARKFPWLIAGLGAVAAGVAIYFLVKKKTDHARTLTVDLGAGTSGTPAATVRFDKVANQFVNYMYATQAGYHSLRVKLDGVLVLDHGTITMNRDHTLSVSATKAVVSYGNGVLIVDGVRYELAAIPAGTFWMGGSGHDESPVHTVRISRGFSMLKTEVTQGLWQAVMSNNPSRNKSGADYPVENVTWADCQGFIQQLNGMLGGNAFRLPTEAEWEYSCRAGTTGDRYGELDAISWNVYNSGGVAHPVGLKQPNSWGLYDMLGNIQEWCQDWYGPYSGGDQTDPTGPSSAYGRVLRGSTFQWGPVRCAGRSGAEPIVHDYTIGFRLARTDG